MKTGFARACTFLFAAVLTSLRVFAFDDVPIVKYDPSLTVVEGDQPLYRTVEISITSPFNLTPGQTVTIRPVVTILTKPTGVSDATALSYVSFTPATLDFTQPNQTLKTVVTADFPLGTAAGGFAYRIETQGWAPGTQDPWAFLNATIYPQKVGDVPTITLNTPVDGDVFTYLPAVGPLTIPFNFKASAPTVTPITTLDASLNGAALTFTRTTNSDGSITGTGNLTITAPGPYTIRARATNDLGTSTDSAEFTVNVSAPPPVVSIAQPIGPSYTMVTGTTLTLPYSFSATSYYGGIQTLTATLNGTPVTFTPTGLTTLNAAGTGNFAITSGGSYTLVVTATDPNGTATATRTFSVTALTPTPTVTISQPVNGTVITRVAGSPATAVPFSFTALANTGFTISAVSATLNGNAVTVTPSGLGTATAGGTGTLSVSAPGTYTLVATGTSSGVVASASTTFTVTETTPPPPSSCDVLWLPPINLNKVQQGGCVLPIKFRICCETHARCNRGNGYGNGNGNGNGNGCDRNDDDRDHNGSYDCDNGEHYGWGRDDDDEIHGKCKGDFDTSVVIAIFEIRGNGSASAPTLYAYDRRSPNPPTYTIQGNNMYHLNFPVPKGKHTFRVEIYRTPSSSTTPQLLGAKEFTSK
ncbi:hypothetical protein [Oleiharenicola sp. Vm1]|uniref:hypothetical protein n=1 Tax=Oleiharenicola sp. Vm1 TaxID=3398393 RepID=UPI0039F4B6A1